MSNSRKKIVRGKKEEAKAQRVIKIIFVSLIILALVLLISFSFLG